MTTLIPTSEISEINDQNQSNQLKDDIDLNQNQNQFQNQNQSSEKIITSNSTISTSSTPNSNHSIRPNFQNHQNRPPSIGDASQLFGGSNGLDDFFDDSSIETSFLDHQSIQQQHQQQHQQQNPFYFNNLDNNLNHSNHSDSLNLHQDHPSNQFLNSINQNSYDQQLNPYPYHPSNSTLDFNNHHLPHSNDFISRSLSANPTHSSSINSNLTQTQNSSQSFINKPFSNTSQSSSIGYDPPTIRNKKLLNLNATTSLPSSPALGFHQSNAYPFNNLSHPSLSFSSPPPLPPPPPPPPKQRSSSTPIVDKPNLNLSNSYLNNNNHNLDFSSNQNHQFIQPTYPNHSNLSQSFNSTNNYNPITNQNLTHQITNNNQLNHSNLSIFKPTDQPSISQLDDPYGPSNLNTTYSINSQINSNSNQPLHHHHHPNLHQPTQTYYSPIPPDSSTFDNNSQSNFFDTLIPNQPTQISSLTKSLHARSFTHDSYPSKSSPLKTQVTHINNHQIDNLNSNHSVLHSTHQQESFAEKSSQDLIHELDLATQKLNLNSEELNHINEPLSDSLPTLDVQDLTTIPPSLSITSSSNSENILKVPDLQIQPATPEITPLDSSDVAPASKFDVLADLSSNNSIQTSKSSTIPDINCNYNANNLKHTHSQDFTHPTNSYPSSQNGLLENSSIDYPHFEKSNQSSQSYNPYNPSSNDQLNNLTSSNDSSNQPKDFSQHNPYDPYSQSSLYNPIDNPSNYVNNGESTSSTYDLQSANSKPDLILQSNHFTSNSSEIQPILSESAIQSSILNPYDPALQTKSTSIFANQSQDPMLQRLHSKVAVASFGFGGKLITIFPANSTLSFTPTSTGYENPYQHDPSNSSSSLPGTTVIVQQLSNVIPSTDLQNYPGPLFMDGGSKASVGKKRKETIIWLESKLDETQKELAFVHSNTVGQGVISVNDKESTIDNLQDKITLLNLLKVLIEHEGKLSGTSKIEEAVRAIMQSTCHLSSESMSNVPSNSIGTRLYDSEPKDIIASYSIRSSHLDSIQSLLENGDRNQAISLAIEHKMWAHALVISNSLGNEVWRDTVRQFIRYELGNRDVTASDGSTPNCPSNGKEGLRTFYSLLSGSGPAAVDELFPLTTPTELPSYHSDPYGIPNLPVTPNGLSSISRISSPTPLINPIQQNHSKISKDVLQRWRSTVALTIANRVPGSVPFLLRLGDILLNNNRIYAAHAVYLLSNGLSPLLSMDNGTRISLLGCSNLSNLDKPRLDIEGVMLTEVLEFAISLSPVAKSQEQFSGIPHLQAYRLGLGLEYAAFGLVQTANKYCEALAATLKLSTKPCPFYNNTLIEQIKAFSGRLSATPIAEKGGSTSWITRKMARPTLDNVWQSLEGRVHKFVAGEDEVNNQVISSLGPQSSQNKPVGPFSHYSSISPGSTSRVLSRVQSSTDLSSNNQVIAPPTGPFQYGTTLQRPSSGSSSTHETESQQSSNLGITSSPTYPANFGESTTKQPLLQGHSHTSFEPSSSTFSTTVETNNLASSGGWWEAATSYGTPVNTLSQPTFESVDSSMVTDDQTGFIDPMSSFGMTSFTPSNMKAESSTNFNQSFSSKLTYDDDDDDEDLGFGNSSTKKRDKDTAHGDNSAENEGIEKQSDTSTKTPVSPAVEQDKTVKPTPSSSWLGRWFRRDASSGSGPVKANLGQDFSLVYDPETKRWVNKKAGQSQPLGNDKPLPPPPSRAQTASPTSAMRPSSLGRSDGTGRLPPPPINQSAMMGLSNGRSSLDGQLPTLPKSSSLLRTESSKTDLGLAPPPPLSSNSLSHPTNSSIPPVSTSTTPPANKKSTAKKSLRSRYVEIR
ncbi:hypothetical protein O181_027538 [Austropuccinia psidii MF-1]|uniref:Protein transport protein sec16 n=1 Tax=Austropuccinia psidii MF-1 TaxID=1389203 RepID=A0A9Q3H109_9BASI|nr:hypothetical protein [Austropuccinia psidii MF-1]